MGGQSRATCSIEKDSLSFSGELVEQNGGFVSCISPSIDKPIDLSRYSGLRLKLFGSGLHLKFALGCKKNRFRLSRYPLANVKWVFSFPTLKSQTTDLFIPFHKFEAAIRAQRLEKSLQLNVNRISQFQLLYSKFGQPGQLNPDFVPGPFEITVHSISAIS